MVYHSQSSNHHESGSLIWIWSVIQIRHRDNFCHDRLKMGTKIPYFYVDNFSHDQIKKLNSALCPRSLCESELELLHIEGGEDISQSSGEQIKMLLVRGIPGKHVENGQVG